MRKRNISREELFALVWEKPTQEVAKELAVSDVAIAKLCARLQVPKPARGYWARVRSGQVLRRPPLAAFKDEVDRRRREAVRAKSAKVLSKLQQQFYQAALSDLKRQGVAINQAEIRARRLPDLDADIASQILLLVQSRGHVWVKNGTVATRWNQSVQASASKLVEKLMPMARAQLLMFESETSQRWHRATGPAVLVRLTAPLQERIASLVRVVRECSLSHVVLPLMTGDHAWSVRHVHGPEARLFLESLLCISKTELWVEATRNSWREDEPAERFVTSRLSLREIMPIDYMILRDVPLSPQISSAAVKPYRERLKALMELDQVYDMISNTAYGMEREMPGQTLALADSIWFGKEGRFRVARDAWAHVQDEMERWETELEAERSALARSILGVEAGDIVVAENRGRLLRLSVSEVSLYGSDKGVTFIINGTRFRKDGTLGKQRDTQTLHFEGDI
ncbi:hypothetical protein [Rhizobium sp. L1K21]|uniref:hypothetical protein n=1 Tax=Rhizobium sp. L1K21 TaxID=2954933 RepID=UPI002093450C|nr:hypothetical protein [Rhizobium sp. L1K21]MCO6185219.1 hypothetical protein [Rhizobium sp. L1K21]